MPSFHTPSSVAISVALKAAYNFIFMDVLELITTTNRTIYINYYKLHNHNYNPTLEQLILRSTDTDTNTTQDTVTCNTQKMRTLYGRNTTIIYFIYFIYF